MTTDNVQFFRPELLFYPQHDENQPVVPVPVPAPVHCSFWILRQLIQRAHRHRSSFLSLVKLGIPFSIGLLLCAVLTMLSHHKKSR